MNLGDNVCNRLADSWNFPQAILRNNVFKRLREHKKALCGSRVRSRPVGIAATKRDSLPKLVKQFGDL
jgi:hypothetical protein